MTRNIAVLQYISNAMYVCQAEARKLSPRCPGATMFQNGILTAKPELLSDLFQQTIDNTSAVIYIKDTKYRYVHVNRQWEQLIQVTRRDIAGRTDFELFSPEMASGFRVNDERVLQTGESVKCEEVAPHSDGPHTYLSVKFPLRNDLGVIVAMAGISTDITDRVLARKEIDSLRRQYESLLHSVGDGICGLDTDGRITFVNPAMERLLGYSSEEMLGRCRKTFVVERLLGDRECPVTTVLNGGDSQQVADARFRCRDGSVLPAEYVATPLREGDRTVGAVITFRDVRARMELMQSEQEMQAARVVQMALYPQSDPQIPGFDISGVTHPSSHTSGDYYDYITAADGTLAVVVGDVSGHGLGPALEMVGTRASLRAILSFDSNLGPAFGRLNKILRDDLPEAMFVTLFAARLDPVRRTLGYASAGHQAFLLNRDDESIRLESTGTPLGIESEASYTASQEIPLRTGDLVVLATDGIMEQIASDPALGQRGELFGWQRTMDSIRRNRHLPACQILEQLCADVRQFANGSPQKDDVTAVIIKVL